MELEEAKEILINVMADEVVGTYCNAIQKTVECSKNCENEDCFLQQAIDTVITELNHLQRENTMLENTKNNCPHFNTSGISCDTKFCNLDDYISKDKIREKIEELNKNEKLELKGTKGQDRYFIKQMYQTKRNILQDLLKEE